MKFLIDRCAGRRLAQWLRNENHDVSESRDRGPDPGDRIILQWAAAEERILVTMDKDYGEFVFVEKARHCGLIRLPHIPSDTRITLMQDILEHHSRELSERAIITVRGGRIRISRSPS